MYMPITCNKLPNKSKNLSMYKDLTCESKCDGIILKLKLMSNNQTRLKMKHFGININDAYGISIKNLRVLAKKIGVNHTLALQLWDTGVHEARELASMIDNPSLVDSEQMERWVRDFDSWDICDECCNNLFVKTNLAYNKAEKWSKCDTMFVKRAGFVLMANLAIHDKKIDEGAFVPFLKIISANATDKRHLVKKAVNWASKEIERRITI